MPPVGAGAEGTEGSWVTGLVGAGIEGAGVGSKVWVSVMTVGTQLV